MKKFFLIITLIGALSNFCHADEKGIHIGISTGYPPFYFFDDNEKPVGICIDVIENVARQLNIAVQFSSYPWKRMIYNGKQGNVDAIMPLFKTDEREKFLIFPENDIIMEDNSFFALASCTLTYSGDLDDIINCHIGVVENYSYGESFDKKEIPKKTVAESGDQLIQLVLNRRVEMGIGNTMVITYLAGKIDAVDQLQFLSPPVTESPLFIGFSKKAISPEFVARFDKALQVFKSSKDYTAIIERYSEKQ